MTNQGAQTPEDWDEIEVLHDLLLRERNKEVVFGGLATTFFDGLNDFEIAGYFIDDKLKEWKLSDQFQGPSECSRLAPKMFGLAEASEDDEDGLNEKDMVSGGHTSGTESEDQDMEGNEANLASAGVFELAGDGDVE